jgi:hypothetical protein
MTWVAPDMTYARDLDLRDLGRTGHDLCEMT